VDWFGSAAVHGNVAATPTSTGPSLPHPAVGPGEVALFFLTVLFSGIAV